MFHCGGEEPISIFSHAFRIFKYSWNEEFRSLVQNCTRLHDEGKYLEFDWFLDIFVAKHKQLVAEGDLEKWIGGCKHRWHDTATAIRINASIWKNKIIFCMLVNVKSIVLDTILRLIIKTVIKTRDQNISNQPKANPIPN